jgi:non-specific serine/threonine protein kinase
MVTTTPHRMPGTLPPQASGFVGREAELGLVRDLLTRSRLVTVTGAGGVGKTRLAVRVAEGAAPDYRDGVHFIELSAVREPGLLVHALATGLAQAGLDQAGSAHAQAAGTRPDGAGDQLAPLDRLLGAVGERQLLLILDTCEHLVDECARLADTLLRSAPGVTVLATSRQPLDAVGEALFQLPPLPVPRHGATREGAGQPGAGQAGSGDAVELFAQRAAAAVPGFTVTDENLADVITVCQRLDGIPLAIELATVRLRALPLRQMAERIDDRLRLLTGGRRSGTPRHQTLRAAIEWSYSLCTPGERLLWTRLSVFAGGFEIAAAEDVCAGGPLTVADIAPALISLVDKNVLTRGDGAGAADAGHPGRPSFLMPGTLREFAAERLHEAELERVAGYPAGPSANGRAAVPLPVRARRDITARAGQAPSPRPGPDTNGQAEASVRSRFVAHYLRLAERFEQAPARDQPGQYRRLRREHANLRAAFDYALELPGNDGAAVVLATALFVYWRISGQLREGEYWLDQAAGRCPARSAARARVLGTRGYVRVLLGDFAGGRADADEAVAMAATFGDVAVGGRGYSTLHRALTFSGNLSEAQDAGRSAAACLSAAGDALGLAQLDVVDAMLRLQTGEPLLCCESAARGLARIGGEELWCAADLHEMTALGLFLRGDIDNAKLPACQALVLQHGIRDVIGVAFSLGTLAFIAAGEGSYERTAWLLGASAPLWERAGRWYTGAPAFESLHQVAERVARAGLGDDRFWRLRAAGAATSLDDAVRQALREDAVPA